MRLAYGEGFLVAILAPVVVYLFGQVNPKDTFFLIFLLTGAWTIFYSFVFLKQNERIYYLSWGLVLASVSTAFVALFQYALALILVAIIAVIFVNAATKRKSPKSTAGPLTIK